MTESSTTYYLGASHAPVDHETVVRHNDETLAPSTYPALVVHTPSGVFEYYPRRPKDGEHHFLEMVEAVTIGPGGELFVWMHVFRQELRTDAKFSREGTYLWQLFAAGAWSHVTHAQIAREPGPTWTDSPPTDRRAS